MIIKYVDDFLIHKPSTLNNISNYYSVIITNATPNNNTHKRNEGATSVTVCAVTSSISIWTGTY